MTPEIAALVTVLTGTSGIIGWLVASKKNTSDVEQARIKTILDALQSDNALLRAEIGRMNSELQDARELIRTLSKDIDFLRLQLQTATTAAQKFDSPIPTLLKSTSGEILFVNDAYDRFFITRTSDQHLRTWLGTTETSHWSEEESRQIDYHDSLALEEDGLWDGNETFHFCNEVETFRVLRFAKYEVNSSIITGIVCVFIPLRPLMSQK